MFTGAVERWTEAGRPRYISAIESLRARPLDQCSAVELLDTASAFYETTFDAYGALISGAIPAAWITEALFTKFYNAFIRRRGDPSAQTFLLGFDSVPIQAEKNLYDLADWVRAHPALAAHLSRTPAPQLAAQLEPSDCDPAGCRTGCGRRRLAGVAGPLPGHLRRFGHTIYDLDFSNPVPADDPTPLLETCQLFISGQGANPHARQLAAAKAEAGPTLKPG